MSDEKIVKKARFLFALSSTPEAWQRFLQRNHPIGRYFTPRLVLDRLSRKEIIETLDKILLNTNVYFTDEIKGSVFKYTRGHPYELQVLCSNLYENQIGGEVTKKIWRVSLSSTLKELGETVFDGLYKKASPQERKVLYLSAHFEEPFEQKQIISHLSGKKLKISENTIKTSLSRLSDKGLLTRPDKFKHFLPDRLFATYILDIKGYDGSGKII